MPQITIASYMRSHGDTPRGYGGWGFQASRSINAHEADLHGEVVWLYGTYAQVRDRARRHFRSLTDVIAVLP